METKRELSPEQREELLSALQARFEKNLHRHQDLEWADVQTKLEANPERFRSLSEMEHTGSEPDVVSRILLAQFACTSGYAPRTGTNLMFCVL